jgi:hypothetical protein
MEQRQAFDWLAQPRNRRSALRDVRAAINRGQLDGNDPTMVERRAALVEALKRLFDDPSVRPGHRCRAARVFVDMQAANIKAIAEAVRLQRPGQ